MIPGLDVHAGYRTIDWDKVKAAGYRFAWAKCTEGNQAGGKYVDAQFARNVAECKRLDIPVGAYHFAFPLPEDGKNALRSPEEQAELAFRNSQGLGSEPGDLVHAVDAEWPAFGDLGKWGCTAQQISDWFKRYCECSTELFGRKPIIYTYPFWWKTLASQADCSWASEYLLWFADYDWPHEGTPPEGAEPSHMSWIAKTWDRWAVWQHSADKSPVQVPGIGAAAAVDRNVVRSETMLLVLRGLHTPGSPDFDVVHPPVDF